MTDMLHLKAIEMITKHLRSSVANTSEGWTGMALGQYIAGIGFSNAAFGIPLDSKKIVKETDLVFLSESVYTGLPPEKSALYLHTRNERVL